MAKPKGKAERWWTRLMPKLKFHRPWTAAAATLGVFFGLWYWMWSEVRGQVLSGPDYAITAESIEISPPPPWIRTDIRGEVFRAAQLGGAIWLLDADLTERLAGAFALHPWVSSVRRVAKRHPARVIVDLDYRRPVLMVETPAGLLPVDHEGTLLPGGDLTPAEQQRLPRLAAIETQPLGAMGERWGDPRVFGGAKIAAALADHWLPWGLDHMVSSIRPIGSSPEDYVYQLVTRDGRRIYWGRSPSTGDPAELPANEKIARLDAFFSQPQPTASNGDQRLWDVRNLPSLRP